MELRYNDLGNGNCGCLSQSVYAEADSSRTAGPAEDEILDPVELLVAKFLCWWIAADFAPPLSIRKPTSQPRFDREKGLQGQIRLGEILSFTTVLKVLSVGE